MLQVGQLLDCAHLQIVVVDVIVGIVSDDDFLVHSFFHWLARIFFRLNLFYGFDDLNVAVVAVFDEFSDFFYHLLRRIVFDFNDLVLGLLLAEEIQNCASIVFNNALVLGLLRVIIGEAF